MHSEKASLGLKLAAWGGLVFLHFPILIIFLYAFNTEEAAFSFPPQGFTLKWFSVAFARPDVLESIKLSLQIAAIAQKEGMRTLRVSGLEKARLGVTSLAEINRITTN